MLCRIYAPFFHVGEKHLGRASGFTGGRLIGDRSTVIDSCSCLLVCTPHQPKRNEHAREDWGWSKVLNPGIHVGLLATVHNDDDQVNNMMVLRGTESLALRRIGLHPRDTFWYLRWSDSRRIDGGLFGWLFKKRLPFLLWGNRRHQADPDQ